MGGGGGGGLLISLFPQMINSPHFIYLFILNSELLSAVLSAVRRTTAHAIDVVLAES